MVHNSELILKNICLSPTIHGFEFDFQLRMSINLTKYRQMLARKSRCRDSNWPGMFWSRSLSIVWDSENCCRVWTKGKNQLMNERIEQSSQLDSSFIQGSYYWPVIRSDRISPNQKKRHQRKYVDLIKWEGPGLGR